MNSTFCVGCAVLYFKQVEVLKVGANKNSFERTYTYMEIMMLGLIVAVA